MLNKRDDLEWSKIDRNNVMYKQQDNERNNK